MPTKKIVIEEEFSLTLDELCHCVVAKREIIIEMIDHDLLAPKGNTPENWRFDDINLKRAQLALSFYHDLEVNMPGIALAFDLMARIEELENEIKKI